MRERRRSPRISHKVSLTVKGGSFDLVTESLNISSSGAYCQTDAFIPAMTKVNILLELPNKSSLHCKGVIVRCEKSQKSPSKFNTAIFFNEISNRDSEHLLSYIQTNLTPLVRYPRGAS